MQIFRIVLNRSPVNFELIPVYDIHFGTVFHDRHLFNRLVKYIQDNENAYWFCGGDICYDEETEILTPEGWKKFTEIKERDTVICYWEDSHCLRPSYIIKKFVFDYEGIAIKLESRYIDLLVTPEHRVLIKDASKSRIVKRAFELLGRKKPFWIPVAAPFYKRHTANGMQITHHVSEHTIKLLAWIITEGWLEYHHRNGKPFRIGIGQSIKHKEYVKEIEECITKLGLSARKYQRKDGVILWKFNTRSTEKLLSYFDSLDIHRIPRRLLNQDYPNLKILFDTLMKGDGIISKNTYCTTSEKLKDDFLELCCKLGYSCTVTKTSSNDIVINRKCKVKDIYRIYVRKRNGEGWAKVDNVSTQYYKGKVWCVTVPSGFIVVRRNGKIAICGNCDFINLQDKRFEYDTLEKSFQKNVERILTYSVEYATEKLKPIANKCLFMISGNHDCVVWNTEVLTSNGWKKAIEIDYNDKVAQFDIKTKTISFCKPIKITKFFVDKWAEIITNLSEEAVTLNHSLVIDGRLVKVEKIINKGFKQNQQYHAGYLDDKYRQKINLSEDWIKLLTWVIMDGTWVIYSERKMRIQFKLSKERKIRKLTSLLKKLKIPYTIKPATKCETNKMRPYLIRIYGENACKIVNLLERKKKIPKSWAYGLSRSQVEAMLEAIADTDGYKRNNRIQWTSTDIENLETVQLACIFNGIPCRIVKVKYSKNGFSRNRQFIYMAYIYLGPIKGYKAKFTVHNEKVMVVAIETSKGTLITRRNGKISFTGNSTYRIRFGFDPISSICKNLGIKNYTDSYETLVKILFKHNRTSSLTLYVHHGHGYSKVRSGTLLNPLEDAMTNFDADIFIMGHCLSEDTEILTKEGWKGIDEIKEGDEVLTLNLEKDILEYNKVFAKWVYSKEDYPELIHIKRKGLDILVTKDHRIIYKRETGYFETTADNLKAVMKIPQSGTFPTEGLNMSDEEIKLYAWIISEGNLYNIKNGKESVGLNIYQNKGSKYSQEIKAILDKLKIKYTIEERKFKGRKFTIRGKTYKTKDNCLRFYIWAKDAKKIRKILKDKTIPQIFKDKMNDRQWLIFLKELVKGDGYFSKNAKFSWLYYTKNKKLADDIQEMCIKHNLRCSIRQRRNQYELYISKHNTYTIYRYYNVSKTVKNTGRVWCVSVANGTIVTRRNGKVAILGNSHYLVFTYKNFLTLNNSGTRLKVKQKLLLRVGGFRFSRKVGNCSYEEKRGMRPNATGTYIIKVIANPYPVGSLKFSVIPFI